MTKDLALLSYKHHTDLLNTAYLLEPRLSLTLVSEYTDRLKQFADLGLLLDEQTILNRCPIDLVCMLTTTELDDSIYKKVLSLSPEDFTIYFLDKKLSKGYAPQNGPFCCKPEVFSLLSNAYKINFNNYNFQRTDENSTILFGNQIVFLSTRLGIKIDVI